MKHGENKKINISSILLFILIVIAIVLIVFIFQKFNKRNKNDDAIRTVASEVASEVQNNIQSDEEETTLYIEYEGYQVIGNIIIPKIDIEYPILVESTEDSLEKSISRVGNGKVNEIGNLTLSGHNYIDGTMFGKLDQLEIDDQIKILDLHGQEVTYRIFDIYVTDPNNVSVLNAIESDKREVTLITCTNGNRNRLIIKAREI